MNELLTDTDCVHNITGNYVHTLNFLTVHFELEEIWLFSGPTMAEPLCPSSPRYLSRISILSLH